MHIVRIDTILYHNIYIHIIVYVFLYLHLYLDIYGLTIPLHIHVAHTYMIYICVYVYELYIHRYICIEIHLLIVSIPCRTSRQHSKSSNILFALMVVAYNLSRNSG